MKSLPFLCMPKEENSKQKKATNVDEVTCIEEKKLIKRKPAWPLRRKHLPYEEGTHRLVSDDSGDGDGGGDNP